MTSVSSSRPPQPARPATPTPAPARQATPEDARAMNDALTAARRRMAQEGMPVTRQPKLMQSAVRDDRDMAKQTALATRAADAEAQSFERARHERQADAQGYGLIGGNAPAPLPMPAMPSPVADPSAFAQMLADLWTRENGKGSKEVRVRFGDAAWPATGARLVRADGGALEIALFVGDRGQAYAGGLPNLEAQLGRAGLTVDRLVLEDDDGLDG